MYIFWNCFKNLKCKNLKCKNFFKNFKKKIQNFENYQKISIFEKKSFFKKFNFLKQINLQLNKIVSSLGCSVIFDIFVMEHWISAINGNIGETRTDFFFAFTKIYFVIAKLISTFFSLKNLFKDTFFSLFFVYEIWSKIVLFVKNYLFF